MMKLQAVKKDTFQLIGKLLEHKFAPIRDRGISLDTVGKVVLNKPEKYDSTFSLDELLSGLNIEKNGILFLYVGMKRIHQKTNLPYSLLATSIIKYIKQKYDPRLIVVTSYTINTFKKSGVFSINHTRDEAGWAFNELFRQRADYRTPDPMYSVSIMARDEEELKKIKRLDFTEAFGDRGIFQYLKQPNSYLVNISTHSFTPTQPHHIEKKFNTPYRKNVIFDGWLFDENDNPRRVEYRMFDKKKDIHYYPNRKKMEKLLKSKGVLQEKVYKHIKITVVPTIPYYDIIEPEVEKNTYYIIS